MITQALKLCHEAEKLPPLERIEFLEAAASDLAEAVACYNLSQDNLGYEFLVSSPLFLVGMWLAENKNTGNAAVNFNAMLRANQLPVNDLAYFRPGTN